MLKLMPAHAVFVILHLTSLLFACSESKMQPDDRENDADDNPVIAEPVSVAGAYLTCNPDAELANEKSYEKNKLVLSCSIEANKHYDDWKFYSQVSENKIPVIDAQILKDGKSSFWELAILMDELQNGADLSIVAESEKAGISSDLGAGFNNSLSATISHKNIVAYKEIRTLLKSSESSTSADGSPDSNSDSDFDLKNDNIWFGWVGDGSITNVSLQAESGSGDRIYSSAILPKEKASGHRLSLHKKDKNYYLRLNITNAGHTYCLHQVDSGNIYLYICNGPTYEQMYFSLKENNDNYQLEYKGNCLGVESRPLNTGIGLENRYYMTTVACSSEDILLLDEQFL